MKEEKTKKKFNKKKLLTFGVLGIFALALVSAALLTYYGQIQQNVNVEQGLTIDGNAWNVPITKIHPLMYSLEAVIVSSELHSLINDATVDAIVILDTECSAIPTNPDKNSCNDLSPVTEYVLDNTGGVCTPWPQETCEKRIHIRAEDVNIDSLNDLTSMNWESFIVNGGYIAHVDILIDTTGDGIVDDALVFEYDKVTTPSNQLVSNMNFQKDTWTTNAFDDKGIVDGGAIAWQTTGDAGPGLGNYHAYSLDEWKVGKTGAGGKVIDGSTKIIAFQIEVDNWIVDSNGKIRNIHINTVDVDEVTVLAGDDLDFQIVTDFPIGMKPADYTLTTTANLA